MLVWLLQVLVMWCMWCNEVDVEMVGVVGRCRLYHTDCEHLLCGDV